MASQSGSEAGATPAQHETAGDNQQQFIDQVTKVPSADDSGDDDDNAAAMEEEALDEESALRNLTADVRDQDDLERDITYQANMAMIDVEDKKDEKRIERAQANIARLEAQKRIQDERFRKAIGKPELKSTIRHEIARLDAEIELSDKEIADFHARIEERHQSAQEGTDLPQGGSKKLPNESHREYLIRTGKITPFSNFGGPRPAGVEGQLADALIEAEDEAAVEQLEEAAAYEPRSHQNLRAPGFAEDLEDSPSATPAAAVGSEFSLRPRKRKRVQQDDESLDESTPSAGASHTAHPEADFIDDEESEDYDLTERPAKKRAGPAKDDGKTDLSQIDDGNEAVYQGRLASWIDRRSRARVRRQADAAKDADQTGGEDTDEQGGDDEAEWFRPSPDEPDHHFDNGLKLPGDIYPALFDYQKTGVQWLAELYTQKVGGIIGDEMGLGKTVQLISFVAALHYSKMLDKPIIVVAPATVLKQWVNEFHRWWPPMRVSILHSSGSGMLNMKDEDRIEEEEWSWERRKQVATSSRAAKRVVNQVVKHGHVLVTTYAGLQTYGDILIPVEWGYAVLDEGHKIRNPNTAITIYCKELKTPNRIILSGTPVQNNLLELWSLFDFIFPMRLGTLVEFRTQFEIPIKMGGYANATHLQIMTAQKCAEILRDTISPYLLQRLKVDVATDLPKKSEQVLFCKLTQPQREAYTLFLQSKEMNAILSKTRQSFYGIDVLRKICNHPDLTDPRLKSKVSYKWGSANKSGKMQVVKALLRMWKKFGHKTLLFSQGTQMLDILEDFVKRMGGITYLRMDGKTPVKDRQTLVDRFNNEPELDLFLLTTKVGGLGVNLTGANRVIIFDPDWNPSTDIQARERAWRLGQKKEVTIYRLMTAGTIEEKIYHRQIFKQFLSNKVLKDPKQRTTFALNELHDLFTLGDESERETATGRLFQGSEVQLTNSSASQMPEASSSNAANSDIQEDLNQVDGVASLEEYKQDPDTQPAPTEEARLMEGIFSRSMVHSALEHEQIVSGKRKPQANRAMLQADANRVAASAAASLRRAGDVARNVPIGTVTWTGEVGTAGAPSDIRRGRGGPGSSAILAGVAARQGLTTATPYMNRGSSGGPASRGGTPGASTPTPLLRMKDFEQKIPEFIRRHGGNVPTKLLVDHFNQYCPTDLQSAAFKTALSRVAKMEKKGGSFRAVWSLK